MLCEGAKSQRREERETSHDQDHADQKTDEQPACGRKRPVEAATVFLAASEPAIAIAGTIIQKRPMNIATAPARL
jgi:hypothetical protein